MDGGHLAIVLHAHLPFVRHPEHADHLEERWLFEAMAGSYLPLVAALERLDRDHVPARLTLSLSPTLLTMLRDPLLGRRFEAHLDRARALAARQDRRPAGDPLAPAAAAVTQHFDDVRATWDRHHGDVVGAFGSLAIRGLVELWTTSATHAFLPALRDHPGVVRAQVKAGVDVFRRAFGHRPAGFWLPECAIMKGLDALLVDEGVRATVLETHALLHATSRPGAATAAPIVTRAGLACFGRDVESGRQVWSRDEGYPGDPWYRDFHRDAGFELPLDQVREFLAADGSRQATGLRLWRVTDRNAAEKAPYEPARAAERVKAHAEHFAERRAAQLAWLSPRMSAPPVVVAPYDAELFGHWWFEGVGFLEEVFRALARHPTVRPVTVTEHLDRSPVNDLAEPEESSWGSGGYADVWLSPDTAWMLRHVDHVCAEASSLAAAHGHTEGVARRALDQALRECLLVTASDWPFLIRTKGAPHYARARFEAHLARFDRLAAMLRAGKFDETWILDLETRDTLCPQIDPDWFATGDPPQ